MTQSSQGRAAGAEGAQRGHVFVIAAPSGTGKTTLCRRILELDPELQLSTSHTTRKPRAGEQDGVHYHFVNESGFRDLVTAGGFLEHAEYGGNIYGTSWRAIEVPRTAGFDVVLEIEVQGGLPGAGSAGSRPRDGKFTPAWWQFTPAWWQFTPA